MPHPILFATFVAAFLVLPSTCRAEPAPLLVLAQADGVQVSDAWARASAGSATTGAVYLTMMGGAQADQLVGVSTPLAAKAEVHESFTDNGVMKMRPAPLMMIPPGRVVTFSPGGYHIMLTGVNRPLVADQSFPLTLTFAHAQPVTIDVRVQPLGHTRAMGDHMHMQ